jgi:hypothetical protein
MEKSKLLLGTDPELFAGYVKNGVLYTLPPFYFRKHLGVQASADKKHPVFFETKEFKLHEDGAAFEMSIMPSHDPKDLFDRIQECVKMAEEKIISQFPDDCLPTLQFFPTIGFDVERWASLGKEDMMSVSFGCDPDEDAFDLQANSSVIDASQHPYRYAGGHIHYSGSKDIKKDPILATKVLALTSGCAAIAYSDVPKLEKERTFRYGRPGKYRIQNYGPKNPFGPDYSMGIEYRTTSCRWASSWEIAEQVFNWGILGITEILPNAKLAVKLLNDLGSAVVTTILEANQETAIEILDYVRAELA